MKTFLKENLVLIAGIALPLLLAIGFLAATKLSAIGIAPPETPVLYFYKNYGPAGFEVRDGKVYYYETELQPKNTNYRLEIELYLYDPVKEERRKIALPDVPEKGTGKGGIAVEDLEGFTVSVDQKSPDGFVFKNGWDDYYDGGLVLGLFGGSRRDRTAYLQKEGLKVKIDDDNRYGYRQPDFIGWVIE